MNMPGFFITGTDTGVGKTVVAAAVLDALRSAGMDAVPMKPIQTGVASGDTDLSFCLRTARLHPDPAESDLMSPYVFGPPCSPHLAAAQSGIGISTRRILDCGKRLLENHEMLVVEGAGGLLVPLNDNETMLDLIRQFGFPVILVARPGLGTLNHTLLSFEALTQAKLQVAAIFLNDTKPQAWTEIEEDNLRVLQRRCQAPVIARFPWCPEATGKDLSPADLIQTRAVLQALIPHHQPTK